MSLSPTENGSKMSPQNKHVALVTEGARDVGDAMIGRLVFHGAQVAFSSTSGQKTADSLVERLTGTAMDGGMSA